MNSPTTSVLTEAARWRRYAEAAAWGAAAIALLVLAGWVFNVPALKSVHPIWPRMKPNAAVCVLLLALAALIESHGHRRGRRLALFLPLLVLAVTAATLFEYATGHVLPLDEFLFTDPGGALIAPFHPGRMAMPTAIALSFFAGSIALLLSGRRGELLGQLLALAGLVVVLPSLFVYLLEMAPASTLAALGGMALPAAFALTMLGLTLLFARPASPLVAVLLADSLAGAMARRLLAPAVLIPLVLAWLRIYGARHGWYSGEIGLGMMMTGTTFCIGGAIVLLSHRMAKVEGKEADERKRTESELRRLNRALKGLSRCTDAVARAENEAVLLQEVCDLAVQVGGYRLVWIGYAQHDEAKSVLAMAAAGVDAADYVTNAHITWAETEHGLGPTGIALRTGEPYFIADTSRDPHFAPWRERALAHGFRSVMTAPLKENDSAFGTLNLYATERDAFDEEERGLVVELATTLSHGVLALRAREARKQAETAVAQEKERFSNVLDRLPAYVVLLTPDYHVPFANRFFSERFGEAKGRCCFEYLFGRSEPCEICETYKVLKDSQQRQWKWTGPDGRHYDIYDYPFADADGSPLILEMGLDVTEREAAEQEIRRLNNELEQRVAQRTAQLEAANKDLEAFTYSVAHDLRAPLRHVDGFARMLAEDYGAKLDEPGRHFVDHIVRGTTQMGQLIDDLLNLSRVGRHELQPQIVGLKGLAAEVVEQCKLGLGDRHITWQIDDLPFVECDAALMKQVFVNLIGNAVKFTGPRAEAVIEIGRREVNGEAAIFVRDNGVGFDMKYAGKLFGVFQRLHRQEDFEGTGVGLVTVQRIIQKHGGRVWAEAHLDRGATFYFTLPQTAANQPASEALTATVP